MSNIYKFETPDGAVVIIDTKDILKLKNVNENTEITLKNETKVTIKGMWRFYSDSMNVLHIIRNEPSFFEKDEKLSKKLFLNGLFSQHCKKCKHTNNSREIIPCSKCYYNV